jgi:bacterioferritin (cytochrome b1)
VYPAVLLPADLVMLLAYRAIFAVAVIESWSPGIADGLKQLKEQCDDHMKCLVSRLLFLEGAPTIEPKPAATHDSVTEILNDAFAAEQVAIARFTDLCKQCYDAGDMSNFHFYQHLVKWHREGDDKFKGHVAWLQKQLYQLKKLGENDYIAVNATKD